MQQVQHQGFTPTPRQYTNKTDLTASRHGILPSVNSTHNTTNIYLKIHLTLSSYLPFSYPHGRFQLTSPARVKFLPLHLFYRRLLLKTVLSLDYLHTVSNEVSRPAPAHACILCKCSGLHSSKCSRLRPAGS
jgi:hypothetical protein